MLAAGMLLAACSSVRTPAEYEARLGRLDERALTGGMSQRDYHRNLARMARAQQKNELARAKQQQKLRREQEKETLARAREQQRRERQGGTPPAGTPPAGAPGYAAGGQPQPGLLPQPSRAPNHVPPWVPPLQEQARREQAMRQAMMREERARMLDEDGTVPGPGFMPESAATPRSGAPRQVPDYPDSRGRPLPPMEPQLPVLDNPPADQGVE